MIPDIKEMADRGRTAFTTAYNLGLDHAIDIILVVAKKDERFPADLALLLISELEKRKMK